MSPLSIVVRIIILVVAFVVLIALFAFAMKLAFMVAALIGIGICILAAFIIFKKLFLSSQSSHKKPVRPEARLRSHDGFIRVFQQEPQVQELVDRSKSGLPARLSINVPADQEVTVLAESDIAIRIKIKSGDHKGRIGWVDKACVVGYPTET